MTEGILRASYLDGNSILHRCDARIKIAFLLTSLITTALLPIGAWAVYLLLASCLVAVLLLSELPFFTLLKRSILLEFPILLVLLPQLFLQKGDFVEIPLFFDWNVCISLTGLEKVASLLIRSWLSVQLVVLIGAVTHFEDMLAGLRALGLPRLLAAIFGLMWRYLFIMLDEVQRLQRARASRSTCRPGSTLRAGGSLFWRACVTGNMAGTLLLRSIERSERVYQAMLSRGYDGEVKSTAISPLLFSQRILMITFLLAGALLVLLAYGIYY